MFFLEISLLRALLLQLHIPIQNFYQVKHFYLKTVYQMLSKYVYDRSVSFRTLKQKY